MKGPEGEEKRGQEKGGEASVSSLFAPQLHNTCLWVCLRSECVCTVCVLCSLSGRCVCVYVGGQADRSRQGCFSTLTLSPPLSNTHTHTYTHTHTHTHTHSHTLTHTHTHTHTERHSTTHQQ